MADAGLGPGDTVMTADGAWVAGDEADPAEASADDPGLALDETRDYDPDGDGGTDELPQPTARDAHNNADRSILSITGRLSSVL